VPQYKAERARLLTLVVVAEDPLDMDPALAIDYDSYDIIMNVFDRLVKYKRGTTEIEPVLATSWENPEPLTYIFNLREDVLFHDGTPFDAESVKYSFDRVLELDGAPSYLFWVINNTDVLDTYQVQIILNYEFSPFLSLMANPVASIVSPAAVEKFGEEFTNNPVGSGPFKFEQWSFGKNVTLIANEDYFKGAPRLERVVFKTQLEAAARKEMLIEGEVDVIGVGGIPATDLAEMEQNPDVQVFTGAGLATEYLGFNMLTPPLNDSRVREAIAYAIDYDSIIKDALGGNAIRIGGPIPPSIFGYAEIPLRQRDVEKAKQLLDLAGYSDGFDVTLTYNIGSMERRSVAEIIRNNLADVGINVAIKGLDWESAFDEYYAMEHEMLLLDWIADYFDADSYLFPQFHSWSLAPWGENIFGLNDTTIDALIDEGLMVTDPDERLEIYKEAQEKIVESNPCIFLYISTEYDIIRFNVKNWVFTPWGYLEIYELYKE
jgi:peptide/nickel transport system substrate-binding protein